MSRRGGNRVNIATENTERPSAAEQKSSHGGGVAGGRKMAGILNFRLPRASGLSTVRFLRRLSARVASALQLVSLRSKGGGTTTTTKNGNMERSRSFVAPSVVVDSHRSKAIEDCIEFINSSSLQRSNSVSLKSS